MKRLLSGIPTTKLYHCTHCDKAFRYESRLQRHLTAHREKQFPCDVCNKYFSRQDVLISHQTKVHGSTATDAEGNFQCSQCPATLKTRHHLQRHLRAHVNRVGQFSCSHCGKEFSVKHKYQRHMRLHLGQRKFVCGVCGRAFLQNEFLSRHLLTHSGATPFCCSVCGRAFNQLVNLRQHQERVHRQGDEAELKHTCKVCDKVSMSTFCENVFFFNSHARFYNFSGSFHPPN